MSDTRRIRPPLIITGSTNADLQRLGAEWLESAGPEGAWIAAAGRIASSRLLYQLLDRRSSEQRTVLGVERGSLFQCALRIALPRLVAEGRVQATALGIEAGVYRGLRDLDQPLAELGALVTARGLPGRLSATLRELRGQAVTEEALQCLPTTGADLGLILRRYRKAMSEAGIVDGVDVFHVAISALNGGPRSLPKRLLLYDHPLRSRVEMDFVSALVRTGIECAAMILSADHRSLARYRSAWGNADEQHPDSGPDAASGLQRLRRRLFVDRGDVRSTPDDDTLQIFAAAGEDREAVEIVRRIQGLVEQGARYDRIGIVVRSPDIYQPVLEEAFSRADVPVFFSRGSLRPDPAGRAFLALLGCRAEDYSAVRFAEYLSLGQLPYLSTESVASWLPSADAAVPAVNVDDRGQLALDLPPPGVAPSTPEHAPKPRPAPSFPRRWERLLVEASVIGGLERWRRRLEGLERELEAQVEYARADGSSRAAAVQARLDQVRNLHRFALPLIERLAGLPDEADVGDWIPALEILARGSLRHPRRALSLLADLRPMAGVGNMRFAEMRRLLEQRLGELRLEPDGSAYGKVFVGTPEEFRGLSFESVFVCGLAEGIFPRKVREDPLLLDEPRRELGVDLQTNEERVDLERLRLQTAAAAAESRLLASYPTWDALTGRARVPSFYAFDTVAAGYGRLEPLTEVSSRSPVRGDPSLAIDAAEFDTATLLPMLRATAEPGSCSYLLGTNRHLKRSLRTRGRRWLNFLSAADGLADPQEDTLEMLERYRLRDHPYSPTTLQHFAACPYRFFLHGVLRLRPREEAEDLEQLDPLTRGSLYHAIQFHFLRALAEQDRLRFDDETRNDLLERLDRSIETVAGQYAERLRPALPAVYRGEVDELRTDLRGWLRQLIAEPDFVPSHFELSFGLPTDREHDPASSNDPVLILDALLAKGSIDMVERSIQGACRVTDHKTGKPRDTRSLVVGGGEALQPLVYAYAAAALLDSEVGEGRLWYSTRRGRYSSLTVPTGDYQRHSLGTVLATVDRALKDGLMPAAPREGACSYCDFRPVCGPHEELRIDIKMRNPETRERLADLSHMRKME